MKQKVGIGTLVEKCPDMLLVWYKIFLQIFKNNFFINVYP